MRTIIVKDGDNKFLEVSYSVFKSKIKNILYNSILELKGEIALNRFKSGKVTLAEIGICNGISKLIDNKLQEYNENVAILYTDNLTKFINDLEKLFK